MARLEEKAPIWNTLVSTADAVAFIIAVDADRKASGSFIIAAGPGSQSGSQSGSRSGSRTGSRSCSQSGSQSG
jgi:hypothetical protein